MCSTSKPSSGAGTGPQYLHGLSRVLLELPDVLLDEHHLLPQEGRLLGQGLHVAEHAGHVLQGLQAGLCARADTRTVGEHRPGTGPVVTQEGIPTPLTGFRAWSLGLAGWGAGQGAGLR